MKSHVLLIAIFSLLFFTSAYAKDDITKELITSNGKTRAYYLYVPSTLKPGAKSPLIVMLHGSGRVGMSLVEKWKDLARKEGFIIAGLICKSRFDPKNLADDNPSVTFFLPRSLYTLRNDGRQ